MVAKLFVIHLHRNWSGIHGSSSILILGLSVHFWRLGDRDMFSTGMTDSTFFSDSNSDSDSS